MPRHSPHPHRPVAQPARPAPPAVIAVAGLVLAFVTVFAVLRWSMAARWCKAALIWPRA